MEVTVEESRICKLLKVLLKYNYEFDPRHEYDLNVSCDLLHQFLTDIHEADPELFAHTIPFEIKKIKDQYEEIKQIGLAAYFYDWYESAQLLFEEQNPSRNAIPEVEMQCPGVNVDMKMTMEISPITPQSNFPTRPFDGPCSSVNLNPVMQHPTVHPARAENVVLPTTGQLHGSERTSSSANNASTEKDCNDERSWGTLIENAIIKGLSSGPNTKSIPK